MQLLGMIILSALAAVGAASIFYAIALAGPARSMSGTSLFFFVENGGDIERLWELRRVFRGQLVVVDRGGFADGRLFVDCGACDGYVNAQAFDELLAASRGEN